MRRITFITLLLLSTSAFAAVPPSVAAPKLQVTKPIYQWKTESNNVKDGGFDHCLIKNMYDNGTMLLLAQNRDDVVRLALHFPQDKMKPNQQFDLTIQIDKRDVFPVDAIAVSSQVLTIGIPEALPDQMRKGNALYLRGPSDEVVFTLDGMDGAVTALRDCVLTNKDLAVGKKKTMAQVPDDLLDDAPAPETKVAIAEEPKKEMPPVTAQSALAPKEKAVEKETPKAAPAHVAAPEPQEKITPAPLLPEDIARVVTKAGVMPTSLLMGKTGNAGNKPLDYAWQQADLFIGVKQLPAITNAAKELSQAATRYLSGLRGRCNGEFVAEASNFVAHKTGGGHLLAEIACSPRDGNMETIGALLFTSDARAVTVYFVEAPSQKGAQAIKTRNGFVSALPF